MAGLRAVKRICVEDENGQLSELQAQFLSGVQRHILDTDLDLEKLRPIDPAELAATVAQGEFRNRILCAGVIAACIDGEMNPAAVDRVEAFASALEVDRDRLRVARHLADRNLVLARIEIVRGSLAGVKVRETIRQQGFLAMAKQFLPLFRVEIPSVTKRYETLESYPDGTLGREFWSYLVANHFPLPGRKGAGPEIIVIHDCLHILGGYGTTPDQEIEVAAFQAGCQSGDPLLGLLFGLAQYHLNIQVAPVAPAQSLKARPELVVEAFARGCKVNRDMWRDFVPWDHFEKSVADLRRDLNIMDKPAG